jgi:hypothetical protein
MQHAVKGFSAVTSPLSVPLGAHDPSPAGSPATNWKPSSCAPMLRRSAQLSSVSKVLSGSPAQLAGGGPKTEMRVAQLMPVGNPQEQAVHDRESLISEKNTERSE